MIGRQNTQGTGILMHIPCEPFRQTGNGLAIFTGPIDDLVIDVRNVANIGHLISQCFQPAIDDVKRHHHACMSDMAVIVNGHAAYVHTDLARFNRFENLLASRQTVVYLETVHLRL